MLNTKDITVGSGKLSKTIKPGNIVAKILDISLQPLKSDPNAMYLILHLEGEDQGPDFEGFMYDKDQPNKGRAKGQVGKVRYSLYPYRDGVTKAGKPKNRDFEIMRSLVEIATLMNKREELNQIEARDVQDLIRQSSKVLCGNQFYYWCIGGSAFIKDDGYKDFTLSLPKYNKNYINFEVAGATPSKVATFDYKTHVEDKTEETDAKSETSEWGTTPSDELSTGSWKPTSFEI